MSHAASCKRRCLIGAWLVLAVAASTSRAGLVGVKVSFMDDVGTESTVLNDGDDGMVDCKIGLGDVINSPNSQYGITAIDPTKPIVVAVATPTGFELKLTNITFTAFDDFVSGTVVVEGMWEHIAGMGDMTVAVGGTFGAGTVDPNNPPDAYSVSLTGEVGPFMLTVGPLIGPATPNTGEAFGDSDSQPIELPAGLDLVRNTLTFSLDRVGSTLTFPDSADLTGSLSPTTVPEPSTFALAGLGVLGAVGLRWRARRRGGRLSLAQA